LLSKGPRRFFMLLGFWDTLLITFTGIRSIFSFA
jgi:hypothetical protein